MPEAFSLQPIPPNAQVAPSASARFATGHPPELFVDLASHGLKVKSYYAEANPPYGRVLAGSQKVLCARASVAQKLSRVNAALAPFDAELLIWDAYRTPACQMALWEHFVAQARIANPKASDHYIEASAEEYCSNPHRFSLADPLTWSPHYTGGAVDLTLIKKSTGALLDMGGAFDDTTPASRTDFYEATPSMPFCANRRLLYHAMVTHGFVNYPLEWWHYELGTLYWATLTQQEAFYPPVLA